MAGEAVLFGGSFADEEYNDVWLMHLGPDPARGLPPGCISWRQLPVSGCGGPEHNVTQ